MLLIVLKIWPLGQLSEESFFLEKNIPKNIAKPATINPIMIDIIIFVLEHGGGVGGLVLVGCVFGGFSRSFRFIFIIVSS